MNKAARKKVKETLKLLRKARGLREPDPIPGARIIKDTKKDKLKQIEEKEAKEEI